MIPRRGAWSRRAAWALYDFANTSFSMNVVSLYGALWVTTVLGASELWYSVVWSGSLLLAGGLMPVLGVLADRRGRYHRWLIGATLACVGGTTAMGFTRTPLAGLAAFGGANTAYQLGLVFYNSLLLQVSGADNRGRVSGLGIAVGYGGTLAGLLAVRPFVEAGGYQAAFVPTAGLFLVCALPCFLWVRTAASPRSGEGQEPTLAAVRARIHRALETARTAPGYTQFLRASFWYLMAVYAVILFMSVYLRRGAGLTDADLQRYYLSSTVAAMGGAAAAGVLADHWGPLWVLRRALELWLGSLLAVASGVAVVLWVAGPLLGAAMGAIWTTSRVMLVERSPAGRLAETFAMFTAVGIGSAIAGSCCWGGLVRLLEPLGAARYHAAVLAQGVWTAVGWVRLRRLEPVRT